MTGSIKLPTIITAGLVIYNLISWIILLAGVGALHSYFEDISDEVGETLSYHWWVIWFALPMIIGALVAAVMQHPTILVRPLSLLFAIEFTKLTVVLASIHKSKQALDDLYDVPTALSSRVDTMMAGGLMLAIGTLGMTLWLAVLDAYTVATPPSREAAAPGHAGAPPNAGHGGHVGAYNYGHGQPGVVNAADAKQSAAAVGMHGGPVVMVAAPAPDAGQHPSLPPEI